MGHHDRVRSLLTLTLTPGLGPVLIARLLEVFVEPAAVLDASLAGLRAVRGIGDAKARAVHSGLRDARRLADDELALCDRLGVRLLARTDPTYPPLLAQIPDAPPILYVQGDIRAHAGRPDAPTPPTAPTAPTANGADPAPDRYGVAIVGSRRCTPYGIEQAERFATALAPAGLTIVSGGARGIDTAAHRATLRVGGRTIAVLGCGLAQCYPEENRELFDQIAAGGAVVSELPLRTSPAAENFPARNRIISGLSLGVLVIEAGAGSGALITARQAVESHGREVFAIPGRVDSPASRGSLDLIKSGGAALVTEPADILAALETPARHVFGGTHEARYAPGAFTNPEGSAQGFGQDQSDGNQPFPTSSPQESTAIPRALAGVGPQRGFSPTTTPAQTKLLAALIEPRTMDELVVASGLDAATVRSELTLLELRKQVVRRGPRLERAGRA